MSSPGRDAIVVTRGNDAPGLLSDVSTLHNMIGPFMLHLSGSSSFSTGLLKHCVARFFFVLYLKRGGISHAILFPFTIRMNELNRTCIIHISLIHVLCTYAVFIIREGHSSH